MSAPLPYGALDLRAPLDKRTRDAIANTKPIPHPMPARPFDRSRLALWLCPACSGWGEWNAPDRTHCRTCHAVRGT